MSVYEWILSSLKYVGLLLATASSIWNTTNIVSYEKSGAKLLTRAGKVSITLTFIGLGVSVVSNAIQDFVASHKARDAAAAELRRMNRIILAGQPLTRLAAVWTFDGVGQRVREFMTHADEEIGKDWSDAFFNVPRPLDDDCLMNNYYKLYPFLRFVANDAAFERKSTQTNNHGDRPSNSVLALIALDNGSNVTLPFGLFDDPKETAFKEGAVTDRSGLLPGLDGIRLQKNLDFFFMNESPKGMEGLWLEISAAGQVTIRWDLDAARLRDSVQRQNKDAAISANIPAQLKILILYDMQEPPVRLDPMIKPARTVRWSDLWQEQDDAKLRKPQLFAGSSIRIVPNDLLDQTFQYQLNRVIENPIRDNWGEDCDCKSLLFVFQRTEGE